MPGPRPHRRSQRFRLTALAFFFLAFSARAQVAPFADDFETGTYRMAQTPPGKWTDSYTDDPSIVLSATSAAAHRGAFGFRVADGRSLTGAGVEGTVIRTHTATSGDLYVRYWFRYTATALGEIIHVELFESGGSSLYDLHSNLFTGQLDAEGFVAGGTFNWENPVSGFSTNTWYLVEQALLGVGTANGQRKLWVNGQLQSTGSGLDYSGLTLSGENLGEPNSDDRRYTGNLDYDDYRSDSIPLASHLGLAAGGPVSVNGCAPLVVSLLDSVANAPAVAPYAVDVALSASGSVLTYYQDATCTAPTTSLTIPTGSSSSTVYLGGTVEGTATLTASHVDFLSGSASVDVGPATVDAADAGSTPLGTTGHFAVGCVASGQAGGLWLGFGVTVLGLYLGTRRA